MLVSRGAVITIGVIGAAASVAALGYAYESAAKTKTSASAAPGLSLRAVQITGGAPGRALAASLTVSNTGGATAAQVVHVGIVLTQGAVQEQTYAAASVPAITSGGTATVSITSVGPVSAFQNGAVKAVFALANGSTISGTFQVAALPAAWAFVAGSLSISSPVQPGQYATATIQVQNTGGTTGTPSVSGVTDYNGTQEGTWAQTNTPSIPPGLSAPIQMKTAGPISSQFAGDTLTAVFAVA